MVRNALGASFRVLEVDVVVVAAAVAAHTVKGARPTMFKLLMLLDITSKF